jgi:hypothetical protein
VVKHPVIRLKVRVVEVSPPFQGAFALINSPVGCFRQKPDFCSGERGYWVRISESKYPDGVVDFCLSTRNLILKNKCCLD